MRSVSAAFAEAILGSYRLATEAVVTDAAGTETPVNIVEGTVTLDQTAAVRGRCELTIVDDGTLNLVPTSPASLLAPYGNEITLRRGIEFADGTTELVALGVFRLQATSVEDVPGGRQIKISGLDRAQRIIDARFEAPAQYPTPDSIGLDMTVDEVILSIVQAAWPDVTTDLTATALKPPTIIVQEGDDRWALMQSMAAAISMRLYFDGDGTLLLRPDTLGSSVLAVAEGEGGVLLTANRDWTREGAPNRVIATGENTGETAPVRGVATDDNPLSPTYYYGDFGRVPFFYSSPLLITDAQCAAAAQTRLNNVLGTTQQVSFGSLVLPHLEPGDTVTVTREASGISEEAHIIDSLTIPLDAAGTMNGRTRARQIT